MKIRIGHCAYSGANRASDHDDKYDAASELMTRGIPWNAAFAAIKPGYRTMYVPNTFDVIEIDVQY